MLEQILAFVAVKQNKSAATSPTKRMKRILAVETGRGEIAQPETDRHIAL